MFGNLFAQRKHLQQGQGGANPPPNVPQQSQPWQQGGVASQAGAQGPVLGSSMEPVRRQELSALSRLDSRAAAVLNHAQQEAARIKQEFIEPEQLLLGLLYDQDIFELLQQFSVDVAKLTREIQEKEQQGTFTVQPQLSDTTKKIFEASYKNAKDRGSEFITPEDLLLTLFSANTAASAALQAQGLQKEQLEEKLEKTANFTSGKKSILERYGVDLTQQAREGTLDPIYGRDKEIERATHILLRRTKNNPIIIGEAGVGKTAIVEGLAQNIAKGEAPKDLSQRRIIQLDLSSLVAGASHRGEFEERLRGVIKDAMASTGQIILFIDEIHTLVGTGDTEGALDASNIVKPFLARGQLQIIGTTTTAEYRKYFERDKAFERRFQPILCDEPSEEVAIGMMKVLQPKYEKFHNVVFDEEAISSAVHLSKKYIGERYLPDKGVDLLDEAAAQVKLQNSEGKRQDNNVHKSDIEKVVSSWTGIPITRLTEDESQKLLKLEELIHARLIDQEEAVVTVAEAVRRGRIGLAAANRPIASFVFLGPTGVGKTELAKTLAEILFGREDATARLDMSEYMEKHEVAKLIGAPPGYVGYEEGGQLTEAVRAKPYSIVLLDEVEKAHPDVFNILLQLLEDGRLTDNKGNTISFKNTIVIATSNIGSTLIQQELSKGGQKTQEQQSKSFAELTNLLIGELHKFFKPELLNRFDGVVVFKPLGMEHMTSIAKLNIAKTAKLLKEQGYSLQISEKALGELAKEGYDPVYGARPLRRLIQTAIENPIALLIISKQFATNDTIVIDYDEQKEEFTFNKGAPTQAQQPQQGPAPSGAGQGPTDQNQPQGESQAPSDASSQVPISEPPAQPEHPPPQPEPPPQDGTTGASVDGVAGQSTSP